MRRWAYCLTTWPSRNLSGYDRAAEAGRDQGGVVRPKERVAYPTQAKRVARISIGRKRYRRRRVLL
jgi:hypothetical protein